MDLFLYKTLRQRSPLVKNSKVILKTNLEWRQIIRWKPIFFFQIDFCVTFYYCVWSFWHKKIAIFLIIQTFRFQLSSCFSINPNLAPAQTTLEERDPMDFLHYEKTYSEFLISTDRKQFTLLDSNFTLYLSKRIFGQNMDFWKSMIF